MLRVSDVYRHDDRETDGQTLQGVQHEQQANIVRVPAEIRPRDGRRVPPLDPRRIRSGVGHSRVFFGFNRDPGRCRALPRLRYATETRKQCSCNIMLRSRCADNASPEVEMYVRVYPTWLCRSCSKSN